MKGDDFVNGWAVIEVRDTYCEKDSFRNYDVFIVNDLIEYVRLTDEGGQEVAGTIYAIQRRGEVDICPIDVQSAVRGLSLGIYYIAEKGRNSGLGGGSEEKTSSEKRKSSEKKRMEFQIGCGSLRKKRGGVF